MTGPFDPSEPNQQLPAGSHPTGTDPQGHPGDNHGQSLDGPEGGHGGHRWLMIACCIPMVVIVGILLATGVAGTGAIVFAVVCLGMMALMMFAMPGGHNH